MDVHLRKCRKGQYLCTKQFSGYVYVFSGYACVSSVCQEKEDGNVLSDCAALGLAEIDKYTETYKVQSPEYSKCL